MPLRAKMVKSCVVCPVRDEWLPSRCRRENGASWYLTPDLVKMDKGHGHHLGKLTEFRTSSLVELGTK